MSRAKHCTRCGWEFISESRMERWRGGCGVCVRSAHFPDLCKDCGERRQEQAWCEEMMTRIEGWAVYQGTRRLQAEGLAAWLHLNEPKRGARHYVRWCFLWEITGEREPLRKIVERMKPKMRRERRAIEKPPTMMST